MKRAKRKPTIYRILAEGEPNLDRLTQELHLLGSIEAFTPDQARRRAVAQLAPVAQLAAERGGRIELYAVPQGSMTKTEMRVRPQAVPHA